MKLRFPKKHRVILIFCAPLVVIVATVVSIFLPNFTEKPQYDFLYMKVGETQIRYIVKAGLTGKGKIDKFSTNGSTNVVFPKLFFYDVSTNTNYEISFSAAEKFSLDSRKMY